MPNATRDIIVVDDNPVLSSMLAEIFKEFGWNVRTASDGFAALAEIRTKIPDLLISDLNMAGMSGFELLSVVRCKFPAIAVIAMSGDYSGFSVPSGVAADAFYAKGDSSIARLLDRVVRIDGERGTHSTGLAVPILIPSIPSSLVGVERMITNCPECLRALAHAPKPVEQAQTAAICLHCACRVDIGTVPRSYDIDHTEFINQL